MDEGILRLCRRITATEEYHQLLERQREAHETSGTVLWITSGLAVVSFVCSSITFILVILALLAKHLPQTKYSIVSSRTLSDCVYSAVAIGIAFLSDKQSATFPVIILFIFSSTFGLIHLGLSHFVIIALKQATARHLDCLQFLTIRRTITVLILLWILSILYCTAFFSLAVVLVTPKYSAEMCTYQACQKPLLILSLCLIGLFVFGCALYYFAVVLSLHTMYKSEKIYSKVMITRQRLFDFLSFGGHILFFTVTFTLIFVCTVYALRSAWIYDRLRIFNECHLFDYIETFIHVENLAGSVVLLYCCRIVLDSVLLIIAEPANLLRWILYKNEKPLDDTASTLSTAAKTNSLKWYCTTANCSITTCEKAISAWDMKN